MVTKSWKNICLQEGGVRKKMFVERHKTKFSGKFFIPPPPSRKLEGGLGLIPNERGLKLQNNAIISVTTWDFNIFPFANSYKNLNIIRKILEDL